MNKHAVGVTEITGNVIQKTNILKYRITVLSNCNQAFLFKDCDKPKLTRINERVKCILCLIKS